MKIKLLTSLSDVGFPKASCCLFHIISLILAWSVSGKVEKSLSQFIDCKLIGFSVSRSLSHQISSDFSMFICKNKEK